MATCLSIIDFLIFSMGASPRSLSVAWMSPPRLMRGMAQPPELKSNHTTIGRTLQERAMIAVPNLIAGRWEPSRSERTSPVHNPSTGQEIARVHLSSAAEVEAIVKAAHAALPAWAET